MMSRALWAIVPIVFVDVMGFAVVIPLLPFYAEHFGASAAAVGGLFSIYAFCSLLAAPLLGRWSDRFGRRRVLLISQCGTLLGFVILALAPSLTWLFVGRALDGFTAANIVTARAYISDVTPREHRTRAFGLVSAAFGVGFMIGPGAAGILAHHGFQWPLWLAAALSLLSIVGTAVLLPRGAPVSVEAVPEDGKRASGAVPGLVAERPSVLHSAKAFLSDPALSARLWCFFGFLLGFSIFTGGFALFCERRLSWNGHPFGTSEVGWVLAYVGFLGLIVQLGILHRLVRWLGESRLVAAAAAVGVLAYLSMGAIHNVAILFASITFVAGSSSVLRPAVLGLISMLAPAGRLGEVFGVSQVMQSGAQIAGPLIAGGLIQAGWLNGWALACAVPLAAAFVIAWRVRRD